MFRVENNNKLVSRINLAIKSVTLASTKVQGNLKKYLSKKFQPGELYFQTDFGNPIGM